MTERRRSPWRSPSLIGAVLVVVAGLVTVGFVAYEQMGARAVDAPVTEAGVPTALPDGSPLPAVPEAVAGAFDRPVVAAGEEDDPRNDLTRCGAQISWEAKPSLRASVVTPEGLTVTVRGEEGQTGRLVHVTCHARWDGRAWRTWASWAGDVADMEAPAGPLQPVCCREDGLTVAGGEVLAPEGTAWTVQERGTYWLAYPVGDDRLVHPVWPVEEGQADPPRTVHLDASGTVLFDDAEEVPGEQVPGGQES